MRDSEMDELSADVQLFVAVLVCVCVRVKPESLHAQFWDMTENCLVRVHQEMDERENSLHVVGAERWNYKNASSACVLMAAKLNKDNSETVTAMPFQSCALSLWKHVGHAVMWNGSKHLLKGWLTILSKWSSSSTSGRGSEAKNTEAKDIFCILSNYIDKFWVRCDHVTY